MPFVTFSSKSARSNSESNLGIVEDSFHFEIKKPAQGTNDDVVLEKFLNGDRSAAKQLFRRYAKLLEIIVNRIIRDPSESEDVVQELFLFLQQKSRLFDRANGSAHSWIIHMAYQRAIDRRRYLARRSFYDQVDAQERVERLAGIATTEADYSPEAVFGRNGLEKLLAALSEDQRETLRLYFFEGYTLSEISDKLGQTLGNVRNHYYRALDKLRKQMFGRKVRNT